MPKVSVIVPVYNVEKYIESCIRSVLNQTYPDVELVLVNDGSKDASEAICRTFADADERVVLISQPNGGVSAARNTGLRHATGEFVTFLDSDDELHNYAISLMMEDMDQYQADLVIATKEMVRTDGTFYCTNGDGETHVYEGIEMLKRSLCHDRNTRALHGKLFRKSFIDDIRFEEGHNIHEDGYFLFCCLVKQPKIVQHNVSVYKYYERENSLSRGAFSEKYFDMLYFCNLKKAYIQEHVPELLEYAKDMEVRCHLLFLDVLCKPNSEKYVKSASASAKIIRKRLCKFHPQSKHERMLLILASLGLYPLYRAVFRMKFR